MDPTRVPSADDGTGGRGDAGLSSGGPDDSPVRSPIRIAWRSGTLGVKVDECSTCGQIGRHKIERQYRWFEIGPVGVVPLWVRHGLECGSCWAWTPLPWRAARRGARTGLLPLPERPRPHNDASVAAGGPRPDFDRVVSSRSLDGGTAYLAVWAIAVAILIGLAVQPGGVEGTHAPTTTCLVVVGLKEGDPVPTTPIIVSGTLCLLPHNFEPLANIPLVSFAPAASVPPYEVVEPLARSACAAAFKDAFGTPVAGGPVALVTGADPRDWARGDRFTWCVAADPARPWLSAPLSR